MNILKTHYLTIIRKDLIMQYHYSNVAIIPKLNKIILNLVYLLVEVVEIN